jgi:hypothetical protein
MDSCTRVSATGCAWGLWPFPAMLDSKCHHFLRPRCLVKIYPILEVPGWSDWMPGPVLSWGGRHAVTPGFKAKSNAHSMCV